MIILGKDDLVIALRDDSSPERIKYYQDALSVAMSEIGSSERVEREGHLQCLEYLLKGLNEFAITQNSK